MAASGCVAWDDIYSAFAVALHKRGLIQDAAIEMANEEALEKMAKGLDPGNGNVRIQLGGEYVLLLFTFPFLFLRMLTGMETGATLRLSTVRILVGRLCIRQSISWKLRMRRST